MTLLKPLIWFCTLVAVAFVLAQFSIRRHGWEIWVLAGVGVPALLWSVFQL